MRSAGNFSPEWGYLAPAPSFMRTARVVLVATAVGATAGAGVVLSLADRPAADGVKTSIAAHAIVTSAQAAASSASSTPSSLPLTGAAQTPPQTPVQAASQLAPQIQAEKSLQPQPNVANQPVANQSAAIAPAQPSTVGASTENFGANATNAASAPPVPGIEALSTGAVSLETAPTDTPDAMAVAPEQVPPQKKTKHSVASKYKPAPGFGSAIRRLFTAHAGPSYYRNRGL